MTLDIDSPPAGRSFVTTDPDARRDKVAGVRIGLEADEVRAEHSVEDLPAAYKDIYQSSWLLRNETGTDGEGI